MFKKFFKWLVGSTGEGNGFILRSSKFGDRLTPGEMKVANKYKCPDCESPLLEGPHGGDSVNMLCSNEGCGSKFNFMGVFGVDRISDAKPRAHVH